MGNEPDEIIEELFESLLQGYQKELEEPMEESEFAFDSADLLFYKIGLNRGGSYIDFPKWLKNKKTINQKNDDGKCFKYAWTVGLNNEQVKTHLTINILYVPHNTKEARHAYQSKYNLKCENNIILLMIIDGEKWHYLAVKSLKYLEE